MTYHWYYNSTASPGELAQLSSRERSERAAWRSSLRLALANHRSERGRRPAGEDRRLVPAVAPATAHRPPVPDEGPGTGDNEKSPALVGW